MEIAVIGDLDTAIGFRLAGVSLSYHVTNEKEAEKVLKEVASRSDVGLIIINERFAEALRPLIRELSERPDLVIVEIPDKKGPLPRKTDPIRELIRATLGVEIKIKEPTREST